ncbi:hypothetical protein BJY04DRAFT_218872 [Aspergillus karnatakaensis]|uniref:uncharacterized protein n=1 Tax=Aspergillus karnatakaensis TaxID=1810916 RepID=UPI003CCD31AC
MSSLNNVLSKIAKQCNTTPDQVQDVYPCTPLQQGLVALSVTSPGAYMAQHVYKLQPSVDQERMKNAWNTVFQYHAILRTRILMLGESAMQVVLKQGVPTWGDCSDLHAYLAADQATHLQLGEPLSRLAISASHIVWSAHHSIYDGFSIELTLRDVATAYAGGDLPTRPSFRHFIQRAFQQKQKAQTEAFWKKKTTGIEEVDLFPRLPAHAYRPQPNKVYQHEASLAIDGPSSSSVTLSTIANAAWALVQSSHIGGAEQAIFGTTLSGRNANIPDIDKLVGPTLATVPVLLNINRSQTVREYLRATQTYFTEIIPHQHIGLQSLKKINAAVCNFQTLFAFQPAGTTDSQSPYSHLLATENSADVDASFFNYALTVQCSLAGTGSLNLTASYDDNLLSEAQIKRLTFQLQHVISELVAKDGSEKLGHIQLISPEDLAQLDAWDRAVERHPEVLPLDAIRHNVTTRPEAIAIDSWDGPLSYAQLDALAARLAGWLVQTCNVDPETVVSICFHRSQWMIVSMLAVLKAGGAFLLLDPVYPEERLSYMIEMVKAKTILISESCRSKFPSFTGTALVVDAAWFESHQEQSTSILPRKSDLDANRAMYLVFTSGSTGQPKGVIITHASYATSAAGHIPSLGITPTTRQIFFASPAFDLTIYETIGSLMAGATICVPTEEDRNGSVASVINNMNVSMLSLTSSYARHLRPEDVPGLQTLALVGEPLARDVQRVWADKVRLVNAYGPAECSVVALVKPDVRVNSEPADIGVPVAGRGWVVDPKDHDVLLPVGATGELLLEGGHLGRGYLNDEGKTAAAYIHDPLWARSVSTESGGGRRRFYKTGDLVHFTEQGSVVIEGRKDSQVKIRGQRVEVAEVEFHVTRLFPAAAGVAVEVVRNEKNAQLLVVFLFCDETAWGSHDSKQILRQLSGTDIENMSQIKQRLEKTMPHHMVPTRYQLWPSMPTSLAGKLDRKVLREELRSPIREIIELDETESTSFFPPLSESATVALKLNDKILSLASNTQAMALKARDFPLSILGLDSIQLITLITFIRSEYGTKMTVATLYDSSLTVSALAALITTPESSKSGTSIRPPSPPLDLTKELHTVFENLTRRAESSKHKRKVFLTGATGLLGSQILRHLLSDPAVQRVIVHVRAPNAAKGLARVIAAATLAKWWSPTYTSRLECWPGDLASSHLGLDAVQWQILCGGAGVKEPVTSIIHNGAAVQWQAPYHALKAANVDSTVELLAAVAGWSQSGSFTFVSGGIKRDAGVDVEEFMSTLQNANGYSQSKFVAEEVVRRFAAYQARIQPSSSSSSSSSSGSDFEVHHRISIVRPGWVIGTETDAVPNTDDFLWKLVQACIQIGAYPAEGGEMWLAVADAGEVSDRILGTTFAAASPGSEAAAIENVDSGTTVARFWELVQVTTRAEMTPMTAEEWKAAAQEFVARQGSSSKQSTFLPVLAMLQDPQMSFGVKAPADGVPSERVDAAMRSNVRTLVEAGFFSKTGGNLSSDRVFSRSRVNEARRELFV